ncbi:MAG TPA: PSD1 and planctomycete cytochrome C domain-containing protein [Armatimonadaceae bacterium]|nr:PSD1 and planctomycete cytochrome C domain-containing protein [Armatimonadaceae bacterium]
MTLSRAWLFVFLVGLLPSAVPAQPPPRPSPEAVEFFEKRVRPVLADNCVSCHSGAQAAGGFRLDRLDGLRKPGARGIAAVVAGKPDASLLVRAIRHGDPALKMPPAGKLPAEQIAAVEEWVRRGAAVPAPRPGDAKASEGFPLAERRRHWSYRPVKRPPVPAGKGIAPGWNAVDAFVQEKRARAGLKPAPPADRRTLLRRVTFDLTGLPPSPEDVRAFMTDARPDAYERVVERLLASPAYGERWARHWLDLVRYGESLGHELDFDIPNAWRYRDYVVRAFNADVPYDRFVREHIAGDLMAQPRRDPATGRNESLIGTGFWWLGEGKHSPVDVRQEQADRIDNQIDVFGKAFLAQTLACARCHDHKFDPIPTKDYYALYGILKNSRYVQAHADAPERFADPARSIALLRAEVPRLAVAEAWRAALRDVPAGALRDSVAPLGAGAPGRALPPPASWSGTGAAFARPAGAAAAAGELVLSSDPARPAFGLIPSPGVVHSAIRSRRFEGSLRSPSFTIDGDFLHLKVSGQRGRLHVIVENFLVIRDPIYGPLAQTIDDAKPGWRTIDLRLWKGRRAYVELQDGPLTCLSQDPLAPPDKPFDGWIRLDDVRLSADAKPPREPNELAGKGDAEVRAALDRALALWGEGKPTGDDALDVLDRLIRLGHLPAPSVVQAIAQRLAKTESKIPIPTRVAALCEGDAQDERVFVRGSHQTLGEVAPRLNLAFCGREADAPPPAPGSSGRRELAAWVGSARHPLTARVMVNRLWKHHFGVGIVPSTDDFGHMGERPSHPELLDWLASEFVRRGWSVKAMHRLMVRSATYRMSSTPADATVRARDPANALLHRMNLRRLEAEAIRDSLLAVSGRLDRTPFGPSVNGHLTDFTEGRGRPAQGPLDGDGRRSLYVAVRRNFLSPWMQAFDFPTPFATMGRRSVSNVPAQALAMMNGPFVRQQAEVWAARLLRESPGSTPGARIERIYEEAFARPPTAAERAAALAFLGAAPGPGEWADLCHVLFNVKEFIFVR